MDPLINGDPTAIGPYRLIARLGAGGMGLVYLGRSELGRTVAVKVVQAEYAQHPEFRSRFAREVQSAQRVGGHWTAAVLDTDTGAAVPWVATQYIPGPDLQSVVATDFGPLPEASLRVLANRLALALQAVHGAGLVHRDLKPSNVLVTVDGPRVIDFGIARAMDTLLGTGLHTQTGMLIGSPGFMSPEQVRGLELTGASDVFCLGAVLVYAATGRRLFGADTTGLNSHLFRIAEEEPDLTGVPESLLGLVAQCLEKDPEQRPTPEQIAEATRSTDGEEWLPGQVLAQLGRHAAQLLDFAPEHPTPAPAPASPGQAHYQQLPYSSPAPGAYPPAPPGGFGPPPGQVPAQGGYPGRPQHPGSWAPPDQAPADLPPAHPRRWAALAVACLAQLLVLAGAGAFQLALPQIQEDLHIATHDQSVLFTLYAVAFAGLLLLGGHLVDLVGRRPVLAAGLGGFAVASVAGGLAPDSGVLLAARVLQAVCAALLTPAALAQAGLGFPDPRERDRAFGGYAVLAATGSVLGFPLGGYLLDALSWRVVFFGEVLLALALAAGALVLLPAGRGPAGARPDPVGVLLGGAGMAALAYGLGEVGQRALGADAPNGLTSLSVLIPGLLGLLLLAGLAAWLAARAQPSLLPRRAWTGSRAGAMGALVLLGGALFAVLFALTVVLQQASHDTPLETGLALLPLALAAFATGVPTALLLDRLPTAVPAGGGLAVAALGTGLLTGLEPHGYTGRILPGLVLLGLGVGTAVVPLFVAAVSGADRHTGAAGSLALGAQQLGGALGMALLLATVDDRLEQLRQHPDQLTGGVAGLPAWIANAYAGGLWWAVGALVLAAALGAATVRRPGRS